MKRTFRLSLTIVGFITSLLFLQSCSKDNDNTESTDKPAIEALLKSYQDALNSSDAEKVVKLFTSDGILLANAAPTAEGAAAVQATYQYVFDNFTYNLVFSILEIEVSGNTAVARSTSKGTFIIKASGQSLPDENRELFVFEKTDGQWRIAKYMYNKSE